MDKRWYPAAISALILGCGGSVDNGGESGASGGAANGGVDAGVPSATGGMAQYFYGVFAGGGSPSPTLTGGASPIQATGGKYGLGGAMVEYGPISVSGNTATGGTSSTRTSVIVPSTGGAPLASGGAPTGGTKATGATGGTPTGGTNASGGGSPSVATGGIDAGFPIGFGGQVTHAYGVLRIGSGGTTDTAQPSGGATPVSTGGQQIKAAYGVISTVPVGTGGESP